MFGSALSSLAVPVVFRHHNNLRLRGGIVVGTIDLALEFNPTRALFKSLDLLLDHLF